MPLVTQFGAASALALGFGSGPSAVDPYSANVVMLLHADGPNGGINSPFLDSSPNNFTIGNFDAVAAQGALSPYAAGGGSTSTNADIAAQTFLQAVDVPSMAGLDFTLEAWAYPTRMTAAMRLVTIGGSGTNFILLNTSGSVTFNGVTTATGLAPINTWSHIAIVRAGANFTIYINGISRGTGASTGNYTQPGLILSEFSTTFHWVGAICDVRLTTSALYTGNFSPPATPLTPVAGTVFLANFTNAKILDTSRSGNLSAIGSAQISTAQSKFGASSIVLTGATNDAVAIFNLGARYTLGAGDFTFECWVFSTSYTGTQGVMDMRPAAAQGVYPNLYLVSGALTYRVSSAVVINGNAAPLTPNVWHHCALCKSSGQTRLFVDGVQVGVTYADANTYLCDAYVALGNTTNAGANKLGGYLDEVRLTKGIARYPANFTPPTAPFSYP